MTYIVSNVWQKYHNPAIFVSVIIEHEMTFFFAEMQCL